MSRSCDRIRHEFRALAEPREVGQNATVPIWLAYTLFCVGLLLTALNFAALIEFARRSDPAAVARLRRQVEGELEGFGLGLGAIKREWQQEREAIDAILDRIEERSEAAATRLRRARRSEQAAEQRNGGAQPAPSSPIDTMASIERHFRGGGR